MFLKNVSFVDSIEDSQVVVIGVYDNKELSSFAQEVNNNLGQDVLKKYISKINFDGKRFSSVCFADLSDKYDHIVLVGLGDKSKAFSKYDLEKLGAKIYDRVKTISDVAYVCLKLEDITSQCEHVIEEIAFGTLLRSWDFDEYKPKKNESTKLQEIRFIVANKETSLKNFAEFKNLSDGIFLTRNVVSEPANVIFPESMVEIAKKELLPLGVEVEILNEVEMEKLGMHSLLAVAQGSENKPRLSILKWNGAKDKNEKPCTFVGKGITFDSGGISLKPGDGMHEMRYDMAGAGVILGLIKAIALNKLPVNVVGVMALAENMPSGKAQRPGDIVKSMSGQTIEVLNTDAEGRMVLADAMWYTQNKFEPKFMIDLATLTGAIVVALGHEFAGLFSNSDDLANKIYDSSVETGEKVWRMPMSEHFDNGINSDIADMQNIGKSNVRGGSITAAQFLKRFTNSVEWAHIDIAGVDITSDDLFICNKGATGFGVHLLYNLLKKNYIA